MQYKTEFLPREFTGSRDVMQNAAAYIDGRLAEWASKGWELDQIGQISISEKPGCLASLLGAKAMETELNCLIFRKA
ncbi:MAG: hypothetical protein ABFE08_13835 [Armatimonadia bacterium]